MEDLALYPATIGLVLINILVSAYGFANRQFYEDNLFWIEGIKHQRQTHRLITSGFLHVNPPHLIINMYVLYEFGNFLEQYLGTKGFLALYLVSLLGGSAYAYAENKDKPMYRAAGASGATSGLIIALCMLLPFHEFLFFGVLPMYGIVMAALFLGGSYYFSRRGNSMIGHGAHLGGALAGMAVMTLLVPGIWPNLLRNFGF